MYTRPALLFYLSCFFV